MAEEQKAKTEEKAEEKKTETEEKKQEKKEKSEKKTKKKAKKDDNVVFVGKKPTMSYVLAVMTQFDENEEVHIKARGRAISRAVDVVEAVKNKFMENLKHSIEIGTDEVTDKEGNKLNISTINISVSK